MNLSGFIFMALSWGFILILSLFCFSKVLGKGLGGGDAVTAKREGKLR